MPTPHRSDTYQAGALQERIEIERLGPSTVEYRRLDGALVIQEQRPATAEEEAIVDIHNAQEDKEEKATAVEQAVANLRTWAEDARNTTVTGANNDTVTQTVVDRLGTFFDRFADLIESR
jgi:hypothetical protein